MVDEMTWKACLDSEIFCEYVTQELKKEAVLEANLESDKAKQAEAELVAREEAALAFEEFEKKIAESPALRLKLKQAQDTLINNPELADKVDPKFISGIMMLDLDGEE
jgi:hypothetical protein